MNRTDGRNVGAKRNSDWHGARKGMSKGACKTRESGGDDGFTPLFFHRKRSRNKFGITKRPEPTG